MKKQKIYARNEMNQSNTFKILAKIENLDRWWKSKFRV